MSLWSNLTVTGSARTARLGFLRPATAYSIRLLAVNEVGSGPPSELTSAVTLQEGNVFVQNARKKTSCGMHC